MTEPENARRRPSGRRSGDSGTRDDILDAALELFAELGYERASVRAIATTAGVDPALIRHFFGDKDGLFAATLADRTMIPARLAASLAGDPADVGRRMTDTYLRLWEQEDTRPILLALVRSAVTTDRAGEMLVEIMGGAIRDDSGAAALDDGRLRRIALAGAHLFGVAFARNVLRLPPLVQLGHAELVDEVSPAIQRYLSGDGTPQTAGSRTGRERRDPRG